MMKFTKALLMVIPSNANLQDQENVRYAITQGSHTCSSGGTSFVYKHYKKQTLNFPEFWASGGIKWETKDAMIAAKCSGSRRLQYSRWTETSTTCLSGHTLHYMVSRDCLRPPCVTKYASNGAIYDNLSALKKVHCKSADAYIPMTDRLLLDTEERALSYVQGDKTIVYGMDDMLTGTPEFTDLFGNKCTAEKWNPVFQNDDLAMDMGPAYYKVTTCGKTTELLNSYKCVKDLAKDAGCWNLPDCSSEGLMIPPKCKYTK